MGWRNPSALRVPAPGIGFSIGEDRLVMSVEDAHPERAQDRGGFISGAVGEAAESPGIWRRKVGAAGLSVERSVDANLRRALEVAKSLGARFALILGDNEIAAGTYSLKNMATGEQRALTREKLMAGNFEIARPAQIKLGLSK